MYKIFSVDDHIIEPADVWSSRVPKRFRDRAPHVVEEDGRQYWEYEDQRITTMGLNAVAGKPRAAWSSEPARYDDMIPGCYDPKERARDLLSQGCLASVNFPTLPRFGGMTFVHFEDKELASACVRAWNDFILDEWCPGGPPGMFVPMVIVQAWDVELAAREVRRCAAKGARALCFVENPIHDGLPSFHSDHWDPMWAAVVEAELPVCMHIASAGFLPIPDPAMPESGIISLGSVARMLSLMNLVTTPTFSKFPTLQIVFSEAGIGWIPAVLERLDRQIDRHHLHGGGFHDLKPSEIFQRNLYACMVEEPVGITLWDRIGRDRILAELDYPHADTPYPCTQEAYAEVLGQVPDDVVDAVSHANASRLFKWEMADESLLTSPEVEAWRGELARDPHAAMRAASPIAS